MSSQVFTLFPDRKKQSLGLLIEETRGDKPEKLLWESLPHRDEQLVAVPLYVGQSK